MLIFDIIASYLTKCIPSYLWSTVAQLVELKTGDRGVVVRVTAPAESLFCVLEQETLSAA